MQGTKYYLNAEINETEFKLLIQSGIEKWNLSRKRSHRFTQGCIKINNAFIENSVEIKCR